MVFPEVNLCYTSSEHWRGCHQNIPLLVTNTVVNVCLNIPQNAFQHIQNSLTYFCRGFIPTKITSKMVKNVFCFPLSFFSQTFVPLACRQPSAAFPALPASFYWAVCTFLIFEISFSLQGLIVFQFEISPALFSVCSQSQVLNHCIYFSSSLYLLQVQLEQSDLTLSPSGTRPMCFLSTGNTTDRARGPFSGIFPEHVFWLPLRPTVFHNLAVSICTFWDDCRVLAHSRRSTKVKGAL